MTEPPDPPPHRVPHGYAPRLQRALRSLQGLAVGDAFGEGFHGNREWVRHRLEQRETLSPPWFWTDDTAMAISIVRNLRDLGSIEQEHLACSFADAYAREPDRGYGGMARRILQAMRAGARWQTASKDAFDGKGSYGNGAAMRAGPLGAYFAESYQTAAAQARLSAEITHAHPEGQAGAVAITIAAAWAANAEDSSTGEQMLETVIEWTPEGLTRDGLVRARDMGLNLEAEHAGGILGSGRYVSSQDTVPYVVWCAARWFRDYTDALWHTASALGDVDTTCAMVGSIVSLTTRTEIPEEWLKSCEALPSDLR